MKKIYIEMDMKLLQFANEDIVTLSFGEAGQFDQNHPDRDLMSDDIFY